MQDARPAFVGAQLAFAFRGSRRSQQCAIGWAGQIRVGKACRRSSSASAVHSVRFRTSIEQQQTAS